jgi:hypothetical protein
MMVIGLVLLRISAMVLPLLFVLVIMEHVVLRYRKKIAKTEYDSNTGLIR